MDRELSRSERLRANKKIYLGICLAVAAIAAGIFLLPSVLGRSVNESELRFASVDRGDIDITVSATGRVVPALEEVISSPVSTRVLEVCVHVGQLVEAGAPLMRLDLDATRLDLDKLRDRLAMMRLDLEKLGAGNNTRLHDLEMSVRVTEMKLNKLNVQLANERHLDSIGGGTTDRVREVEFERRTAMLELDRQRQQLANEKRAMTADENMKKLDIEILEKDLAISRRLLEDAEIRSPRRATVTYVINEIGAQLAAGQKVATVADLGHYRIEGEVADSYGRDVATGCRVSVKLGNNRLDGTVTAVSPTSTAGLYSFSVVLDNDSSSILRPGLKPNVYVSNGLKTGVVRIPNASFYTGPGSYNLYVDSGQGFIERRKVKLGSAGYDYVEVVAGLSPGERIVTGNTHNFENETKIKIK